VAAFNAASANTEDDWKAAGVSGLLTAGPFPAGFAGQAAGQVVRFVLRLAMGEAVASAVTTAAAVAGLYKTVGVAVLPTGAPVTGTVGTAL
jgi:hypothetical protein